MASIVSEEVSGLDDDKSNKRLITGEPSRSIPLDADAISDGDDAMGKREVDQTIAQELR